MQRTRRVIVAVVLTAATFSTAASTASAANAANAVGPVQLGPGRTVVTRARGFAPIGAAATTSSSSVPSSSSVATSTSSSSTTADAAAGPPTAQFVVTYHNFSAAAQTAFQAAVDVWSHMISSSVPIRVDATWKNLGTTGILGQASPTETVRDFAGEGFAGTWYPVALANALAGTDLDSHSVDISAAFNSAFSGPSGSWYFGTDGNPGANQWDLETIVLHELGHGLGFLGSMDVCNGVGTFGNSTTGCGTDGIPYIYDRFAETGANTALTTIPNGSAGLASALQSGSVFFDGPNADAANGGPRPALYAPNPWEPGSSFSHLDETTFPASSPNSVMTPAFAAQEVHHAPGNIVLGAFADMGWTDSNGTTATPFMTPLAFGTVASPGSADGKMVLTNLGTQTLTINSGTQPAAPFSATLPAGGTTLAGGKSIGIPVHFDASVPSAFPYNSSLSITTDSGNVSAAVSGLARSHTDTQAFVYAAYVDFLGRAPTTATTPNYDELDYWTAQLDSGQTSRPAFLNLLSTSNEWVHAIVTELYFNTLGRAPDSGGLDYWTGIIQNGTLTVAQVAAQFYASQEYYNGFGGGTDAGWVHDLYVKILHREPDSSGWNYWIGVTQQQGRFAVAYAFYQSSESAHDRVADLYNKLLGRAPEPAGWDYWSQVVVTYGDIALATNLAASAEYAQRAIVRFP